MKSNNDFCFFFDILPRGFLRKFFLWIRYAVITRKETLVTSLCNLETFSHEKMKGKKCSFVMIVFRKRLLWAAGCKYRFLPKNSFFESDVHEWYFSGKITNVIHAIIMPYFSETTQFYSNEFRNTNEIWIWKNVNIIKAHFRSNSLENIFSMETKLIFC